MGSCDGLSSSPYRCGYISWCLDSAESQQPPTGRPAGSERTEAFSKQSQDTTKSGSIPSLPWSPQETSGEETNAAFDLPYPQKQLTRRNCTKVSKTSRHKPRNSEKPIVCCNENDDDSKLTDHDRNSKVSQPAALNKEVPPHSKDEACLLPRSSPVISRRSKPISWQEKETSPSNSLSMYSSSPSSASSSFDQHECLTSFKEEVEPLAIFVQQPSKAIQDRTNRTPQQSEREHRGWSLNSCSTPNRTGHSSSTPHSKDRSCSDILDFPADIFKTSCELEKENAHFVVVDMILEVLEGVKWKLSFDSLMDKHCTLCKKRQMGSGQHSPVHRRTGQTPKPRQGCNDCGPQLPTCKRRLLQDDTRPSQMDTHCADSKDHMWGINAEEPERYDGKHQQSQSILSTDSGFEDCGVGTVLLPKDLVINAEWLAQQLVVDFKKKWLPSNVPHRGRLSLRSSLQELPGTGGVEVKYGSLTEEIRLRTRMRGSLNWAPPSFQIIFSVQPPHRRSEVVALQHYLCAGCGTEVEPRYIKKLRYCEYLGRYFCDCCHSGSEAVIPGRVLSNWDFGRYSVSDFSKQLLDSVWCQPLFDLTSVGKTLYSKVKELDRFRELREQLISIKKLLKACRLSERILAEFEELPAHLMEEPLLFSMEDLQRVKKGQLVVQARAVLNSAIEHIKHCELCMGRGFICEFCRVKDIIFPFQRDICKRCTVCKACFHIECFVGKRCPKCTRIQSRTKIQMNL